MDVDEIFSSINHDALLPYLNEDIIHNIKRYIDWRFCYWCGKEIISKDFSVIELNYSIVKGISICKKCKNNE